MGPARSAPFAGTRMNSYRQSFYAGLIRIIANMLMVCAIFVAMYFSAGPGSWPAEAVFSAVFFGITIPVWTIAFWLTRQIRRIFPAVAESMVDLPGRGPCLVRWQLRESAFSCGPAAKPEKFHGAPPAGVLWGAEAGASA